MTTSRTDDSQDVNQHNGRPPNPQSKRLKMWGSSFLWILGITLYFTVANLLVNRFGDTLWFSTLITALILFFAIMWYIHVDTLKSDLRLEKEIHQKTSKKSSEYFHELLRIERELENALRDGHDCQSKLHSSINQFIISVTFDHDPVRIKNFEEFRQSEEAKRNRRDDKTEVDQ